MEDVIQIELDVFWCVVWFACVVWLDVWFVCGLSPFSLTY